MQMNLITIWLWEIGSKLIFLPIDNLLHFVLATDQLQVDKRCLIPAYEMVFWNFFLLTDRVIRNGLLGEKVQLHKAFLSKLEKV